MIRGPPRSTPFPYTTLSRSDGQRRLPPVHLPRVLAAAQHLHPGQHPRLLAEVLAVSRQPLDALALGVRERPHLLLHARDRKSTRLNSSHANISYAVFCLKKK